MKLQHFKHLILAFATLFVSACGFQPLYKADGVSGGMGAVLSTIEISPIADRLGQQMRNHMMMRVGPAGKVRYRLVVELDVSREGYGIRPDAAVTQEETTVIASFKLIDLAADVDAPPVLADNLRARTSYDIVLSDFATLTQREDSARRLAIELADRILQLSAQHLRETGNQ